MNSMDLEEAGWIDNQSSLWLMEIQLCISFAFRSMPIQ